APEGPADAGVSAADRPDQGRSPRLRDRRSREAPHARRDSRPQRSKDLSVGRPAARGRRSGVRRALVPGAPIVVNLVGRSFARDSFTRALSAEAFVRAMLDFERALAEAEADACVVPAEAARVIANGCTDLRPAPDALASEGKRSGSLAVPLVKALTEPAAGGARTRAGFRASGAEEPGLPRSRPVPLREAVSRCRRRRSRHALSSAQRSCRAPRGGRDAGPDAHAPRHADHGRAQDRTL